jgi:tRNA modification GTPase
LVDTAGLHGAPADAVEREGIARARSAEQVADLVILVLDRSRAMSEDDKALLDQASRRPHVVVANKCDLPPAWQPPDRGVSAMPVSAKDGRGLDDLRREIGQRLSASDRLRDTPAVTNTRHAQLLSKAHAALRRAAAAAREGTAEEFVAADLAEARARLEEVVGARTPDDVLDAIFSRFCIGK